MYGRDMSTEPATDGRHVRRERSREAVIEAMFALAQGGKVPPSAEDIAERAGVSVSSVFRNFDGLADLQRQALDWFQLRYAHLFVVGDAEADRAKRIGAHVRARVDLLEATDGLLRIARARALDHEPLVEGLSNLRVRFAEQTRQRFATELDGLTTTEAANLAALIDSATSPEAFDVMSAAHARSSSQIAKTWIRALDDVLNQWAGPDDSQNTETKP